MSRALPPLHPDAADDGRYAIVLLKRQRLGGVLYRVGQTVLIRGLRHLRVAAHLVRVGAARPADQRTARDVEVYLGLQAALPVRSTNKDSNFGTAPSL